MRVEGTRKRGTYVVGVGVTRGWHVGAAHGRPRKGVMKVLRGGTKEQKRGERPLLAAIAIAMARSEARVQVLSRSAAGVC